MIITSLSEYCYENKRAEEVYRLKNEYFIFSADEKTNKENCKKEREEIYNLKKIKIVFFPILIAFA